jgi:23S rRNA A2030 N6-methylase RlmJ
LIAWRRKGGDEEAAGDKVSSIVVFKSVKELKDYTKRTQKVFPMREIKHYNGGNVVLRHLLRRIFS